MLTGWQNSGETFQQWTRPAHSPTSMKPSALGLMASLSWLKYLRALNITRYDQRGGVPIALATYGNIFSITRQAIV